MALFTFVLNFHNALKVFLGVTNDQDKKLLTPWLMVGAQTGEKCRFPRGAMVGGSQN